MIYYDNLGYPNTFEYCDGVGGDLVNITAEGGIGGTTNAMTRSVGHKACEDGLLTPEDFPKPEPGQG